MDAAATIFALASGAGRAGVAVVRISGPKAGAALATLSSAALPPPRRASRRALRDPQSGAPLDDALALWFPRPGSFTGEDVAELHIHGGPAVIAAVLEALASLPGLAQAGPGDFTRRAFENGKLDLTAAEGIADLVEAETEGQRRQALRQMHGALAELYESWRARLISSLALYEAEIDFPDEDVPVAVSARAAPLLDDLIAEMRAHLNDAHRGERIREGYRVAIIGAPNAGKSSLLNAIARREAAIVSDIPGTTRDVVEARLVLGGYPVWIADTAGLREAADLLEAEGVRRALARAKESDLRIGVLESTAAGLSPDAFAALREGDLLVLSKADLPAGPARAAAMAIAEKRGLEPLLVSARTGAGVAALDEALAVRVSAALDQEAAPAATRLRHRGLVQEALEALERARAVGEAELAAEDIRVAGRALGRITGRVDIELVLDEIFAAFCIGK